MGADAPRLLSTIHKADHIMSSIFISHRYRGRTLQRREV